MPATSYQIAAQGERRWWGGRIYVELDDNMISFTAGQVISGRVHVHNQTEKFAGHDLTVGLYGHEKVYFRTGRYGTGKRSQKVTYTHHNGNFKIIELVFPIAEYQDELGQSTYPFTLQLPDWLPASMLLGESRYHTRLSIEYTVRAQVTPVDEGNWVRVKDDTRTSLFRGDRMIQIYRPQVIQNVRADLRFDLVSEVGGFLGMGTSKCLSQIYFEKNQYYLGEDVRLRITCDNSACSKDVKNFKFKLIRNVMGHDLPLGHSSTSSETCLIKVKEAGVAKGEIAEDREFVIQIPSEEEFDRVHLDQIHHDQHDMLKHFSISVLGKIASVNYTLKVFVKHDAWNEFGQGQVVSLPILIVQPPMDGVQSHGGQVPADWEPEIHEAIHLVEPQDEPASYQQEVMIPLQQQYQMNEQPVVESFSKAKIAEDPNVAEGIPMDEAAMDEEPAYQGAQQLDEPQE